MTQLFKMTTEASKHDDLYTPEYAVKILLPYLYGTIWECASGKGHISKVLRDNNFDVIETDIKTGTDFLSHERLGVNVIVTNPPYSLKDQFLARCYQLGKPFALLLPLTTLGGVKRSKLFMDHDIQVLIPNRRINFIYNNSGDRNWFHSAWFCRGLLPDQLMFVDMDRD